MSEIEWATVKCLFWSANDSIVKLTVSLTGGQWLTKYFRLALVFMASLVWNNAQRKGSVSVFQELSASINKTFGWALG